MRRYGAALIGYYGFGNLGDELLLKACIDILTHCGLPLSRIVILSADPEKTSREFGVASVNRWSFREVWRAFRDSERVIFGGGGIFQDRTSVKSCAWYWAVVRLARMMGAKVFAVGQSVGPLKSGMSRILSSNALKSCNILHVRDEKSLRLAESLGCKNIIRGCDLVMTLKPESLKHATVPGKMLVNLRPCPELERYAEILRPKITSGETVGVALSPEDESALCVLGLREIVRVHSFREAESLWRTAETAAGMRLHFGVLSRIFRVPAVMMPYDIKVNEFAGQSRIPCISDEWIDPVMPREIPGSIDDVADVFREIMS
ncbi:MAG: polysaccharide pyruvyl transferase CsaB [Synergistaceae bacterium]|nr:polysaccharide pyruvyl transferase CsaB [Synergistaceae bacterium]